MSSPHKSTLVLGASENPQRYSYLAVNLLREHGHPVIAIGQKAGQVNDVPVETLPRPIQDLDTVTLYLSPTHQAAYYSYLLDLHPGRVIFNPGTENPELEELLQKHQISSQRACTLVLLQTGQY